MMTMHLFGTALTPQAVAHNNRGETEGGTVSTLQKVIRNGDLYSTVSSEAIRYALREGWLEDTELELNRKVGQARLNTDGSDSTWIDKTFDHNNGYEQGKYIDDDVLGYMNANAQRSRRGVLEISRAVSTTPWPGTVSSHFASPGSNPSVGPNARTHEYEPIPYAAEVHDTRYQHTFALTPHALLKHKMSRTEKTLLAIQNLRRPAGNHARFLFDFAPDAIVLRWTADPAPRMMFCFEQKEDGRLSLAKLVARVQGGDIDASELAIGTAEPVAGLEGLKALGIAVHAGVKKAFADILSRIEDHVFDLFAAFLTQLDEQVQGLAQLAQGERPAVAVRIRADLESLNSEIQHDLVRVQSAIDRLNASRERLSGLTSRIGQLLRSESLTA